MAAIYRKVDLHSLLNDSKANADLLTIEATVITGFEFQAVDECREKCRPTSICKAKGRIYFNITTENFNKVYTLKSVDNVFLVGEAIKGIKFQGNKEQDLEVIKSLIDIVDWKSFITRWSQLVNFTGILFPEKKPEIEPETEQPETSDTSENASVSTKTEIGGGDSSFEEKDKEESSASLSTGNSSLKEIPNMSENELRTIINEIIEPETKNVDNLSVGLAIIGSAILQGQGDVQINDLDLNSANKIENLISFDEPSQISLEKAESVKSLKSDTEIKSESETKIIEITQAKSSSSDKTDKKSRHGKHKHGKKRGDKKKRTGPGPKPYVDDGILKYRVTCYRAGSNHSFSSMEAAAEFGGKLQDNFNWTVDLTRFNLNVLLVIEKNNGYIASAVTKQSFHRRNITHFNSLTMRATMCYHLIRLAQPVGGEVIIDPLCGGGSIPIEGSISFPYGFFICGDLDEKAVNRTVANIEHLNKQKILPIDTLKWDARNIPLKDQSIDIFVTDLPFGKRCGQRKDNYELYCKLLQKLGRVVRMGTGRASLLSHDRKSLTQAIWTTNYWRQIKTFTINQGGLQSSVFLLLRTSVQYE